MVVILMGVAGSGKTTVGHLLAAALRGKFYDGDDFHPAANVAKMAAGHPLDDTDRAPWLDAIRALIYRCLREDETAVIACSALKASYRARLRSDPARVHLVYLRGTPQLLAERLHDRRDHFLPPSLLASQLATLEVPTDAIAVDIGSPPAAIVAAIVAALP